jgi:hypothetical protein
MFDEHWLNVLGIGDVSFGKGKGFIFAARQKKTD